jgi:GTP1/Obg family GTP-binding protein
MRWPFVTKRRLERELADKEAQYQNNLHKQALRFRDREMVLTKDLREVVRNMTHVALIHDMEQNRWRVMVEVDAMRMSMALERGNDFPMVEMIGDQIKYMAIKEIKSCNIQRPEAFHAYRPRY